MAKSEVYEVYAIKYAYHERKARENFIGGVGHFLRAFPYGKGLNR